MQLSIGMIVKNEKKYLDKCLTAIKPILDNLDSELIIVDTGSTDNTIEIAKKYTNKVYNFKWCDDFAAARNVSLNKSSGEWYMFVDADEILLCADEIINFFKSSEYKNYNCAFYSINSYVEKDSTRSVNMSLCRLYKKTAQTIFKGSVHEYILVINPIKNFKKTTFNHYGYLFENEKSALQKSNRNIDLLLKQLEDGVENCRLYQELGDAYAIAKNQNQAIKFYKIGVDFAHKNNMNYFYPLMANLICRYMSNAMYSNALDELKIYFESKKDETITDIDMYYTCMRVNFNIKNFKQCVIAYEKYTCILKKYLNGKLNSKDDYLYPAHFADDFSIYESSIIAAEAYSELKNYKKARELLSASYKDDKYTLNRYTIHLDIMKAMDDYSYIIELYSAKEANFEDIQRSIESYILNYPIEKKKIINAFSDKAFDRIDDNYIKIMKLRYAYEHNEPSTVDMLNKFIHNTEKINFYCADILYLILKYNMPLNLIIDKIDIYSLSSYIAKLNLLYDDDYYDAIINYTNIGNTMTEAISSAILYEIAMSLVDDDKCKASKKLYDNYVKYIKKYLEYTYNKNVLTDCNIMLLPNLLRCGYYCVKAEEYKTANESSNYLRYLNLALKDNENLKQIISFLIEEFDNSLSNKELSEFELLAKAVKENIAKFIQSGQLTEAAEVLREYAQINPSDPDIKKYAQKLN